jgi:hypothetical protein
MRTSNLANEALRHAEVGHVWKEVISNSTGTIKLKPFQTFRVRAAGATTVTVDGTLAMTMTSGEIAVLNAGSGLLDVNTGKFAAEVTVVIAAASAFVQVAQDNVKK